MDLRKIIIFGTGKIADVAYHCFEYDSDFRVAGFTVDEEYLDAESHQGLPVYPFESLQDMCDPDLYGLSVPIGYSNINRDREKHFLDAKDKGYRCVSYVSSRAYVSGNVEIGDNCFIFEFNNIQPYCKIGDNCILWSGNHIGHHSTVEDHCFISSHVVVSGNVLVGHHSFIGVNATLRDSISIGAHTVIGAGATILHDTAERSVYIGMETKASRVTSDRLKGI